MSILKSFRVAPVFSDGCVLQRDREITIFGYGEEGKKVEARVEGPVLGSGQMQSCEGSAMVAGGRFEIRLGPMKEGMGHTITLVCEKEVICLRDVAIGEVWVAGGQSNMEFELINCKEKDILKQPADHMVRFYYTLKTGELGDAFLEQESHTHWEQFGDEGTKHWSAVATFFARMLSKELQVPVGIIGCNLGGTSASCWMPRKALMDKEPIEAATTDNLAIYLKLYEREKQGRDEKQQKEAYEKYLTDQAVFDEKVGKLMAQRPQIRWHEVEEILGKSMWPGPMGCTNPYRPSGLYECMLKRIMPYTVRGVLFYQGESDEHLPNLYHKLFAKLIQCWREGFQDPQMPFVYALLPIHRFAEDPDFKQWCVLRQAQCDVAEEMEHAYVTNIMDQGVFDDIHPTAKKVVGERMCRVALAKVYHRIDAKLADGPMLQSYERKEDGFILHMTGLENGIYDNTGKKLPNKQMLKGFEIAGEDQNYLPAEASFCDGSIHVMHRLIENPVYVRYLWTNYTEDFLYGENGLPMFPFRIRRDDGFMPQLKEDLVQRILETGCRV